MIISFLILSFSASLLLISTTGFFFNMPISFLYAPLSLVTAITASYYAFKSTRALFFKCLLAFLILFIVSAFLATFMIDFSGDGLGYHMDAILALSRGWNPFKMHFIDPLFGVRNFDHVNHFPKALWIMAACMDKTTGFFETGKLFGLLFASSTYFITLSLLDRLEISNHKARILIAGLVTCNPVIFTQFKSFYVDGLLASLLTCFVILATQYVLYREKLLLLYLSFITVVLVNLKYTALVYGVFLWGALWSYDMIKERKILTPLFFWMSGSLVIAILWVGYQPYVTNTLYLKSPFHIPPIIEKDKPIQYLDPYTWPLGSRWAENSRKWVLAWGFPAEFINKSRLQKLLISLWSRSENHTDRVPKLKLPFMLYPSELIAFSETDTKYAGYGPYFCLASLIFLGLFIGHFRFLPRVGFSYLLLAGSLTLSALLFSEAWWARLAPQLWLVPLLLLAFLFQCPMGKLAMRIRDAGIVILSINILFIFTTCYAAELIRVIDFERANTYLRQLSRDHPLDIQFNEYPLIGKKRLEDAGVHYVPVTALPSGHFLEFDVVPYDIKVFVHDQKDFLFTYRGLIDIYRDMFKRRLKESY